MCSGPLARVTGSDCTIDHGVLAHRRLVAERQAERGEQHPDGELGAEVVDEVEALAAAQRLSRFARDVADRPGQRVEVALDEGVLDQRAQAVVARRIGGAERRAGAVGQFGHHVALGRGVAPPVVERGDDVGEAREDPHVGLLAPEAWELLAQPAVGRKRIGVGLGGKRVETEHRCLPDGGRLRRRPLDARGRLVAFTMPRRMRRVIGRRRSNSVLFRQPARRMTVSDRHGNIYQKKAPWRGRRRFDALCACIFPLWRDAGLARRRLRPYRGDRRALAALRLGDRPPRPSRPVPDPRARRRRSRLPARRGRRDRAQARARWSCRRRPCTPSASPRAPSAMC